MTDTRSADLAATLLRVSLGLLLLAHGAMKIFVFTVPGTVQFFQSIGYPGALAYVVILAEVGGGIALVLGLWSRWVALALVPVLVGATLQHVPNGWMFAAKGGGWEFPAFWTVALLVQSLLGDGAYSLRSALDTRSPRPALG
ncbi:putative oxidoreductase [Stella humosa]|uniref:Putative oxidoreductase n=1 Tax=Stella humosa TaxID=94 RepID=A0A3N1L4H1_9PROT|nr:DoxX family protein [Stella humosa]ROP84305.1 putative oxidoreductase [Stella humosa]BBK33819.1 quinol oxidase [Stella humosa]